MILFNPAIHLRFNLRRRHIQKDFVVVPADQVILIKSILVGWIRQRRGARGGQRRNQQVKKANNQE